MKGAFRMSSFRNPFLRSLLIGASIFTFCAASGTTPASTQKSGQAPMYHNPILFADYSDPDVIRVGSDYYLVASTFHFVPGIPILHSKDLVHWSIAGHVIDRLAISPAYDMQGGNRYGRISPLPTRAYSFPQRRK
jgi:hypothetical protein